MHGNGVDPNAFDPADLFPGKPDEQADRIKRTVGLLTRAGKYGWEWAAFYFDAEMDETWTKPLARFTVRAPSGNASFAPSWVAPLVSALTRRYRWSGVSAKTGRASGGLGKMQTSFLDMLLSWASAGQADAPTRAKALAAVIELAADRRDVEARVNHFINEYDGP